MNDLVERLKALTQEQREIISELVNESRSLKTQAQTLSDRIRELEQQRVACIFWPDVNTHSG